MIFLAASCVLFHACSDHPQQRREQSVTPISQQNMKKNPLRDKLVMALDDMKAKAVEMGIEGVATASVLDRDETDDWIGEMKVVGSPCNEKEG